MCYLQPHFSSSFPSLLGAVTTLSGALSPTVVPFQAAHREAATECWFLYMRVLPWWHRQQRVYLKRRRCWRPGLHPWVGKTPRRRNTLQYSCLEITRTEEPHRLQAMGHKELDTTEVSEQTFSTVGTGWPCVPFLWRTGLRILLAVFKWELIDNL